METEPNQGGTVAGLPEPEPTEPKSRPGRYLVYATLLPALLAMAWLVSRAQWFWSHQPELQFGWVVLVLSAYLFWEAWETKPAFQFRWSLSTTLLGAGGVALLFLFQVYHAAFGLNAASLLGLALGVMAVVAANLHYLFGWRGVRHFAFAFGFLMVALPMPSAIQNPIVGGLQSKVALINVEVLNLIGIPAEQSGSLIRLPNGTVGVDEACSGIRSLQSTLMATLFIGYLTLRTRSLQIALLLLGIGLAVFGNLLRSLFLSYTANTQGLAALDQFHDTAGWSILLFTAAGVAGLAVVLGKAERTAFARKVKPEAAHTRPG